MILKGKFPPDIRVEKEVRTLSSEGHNLFLLCCMNDDQPREEFIEGLRIHRINKPWENMNLFGHKWNALIFHLTFRNHYWAKEITKFIKMYNLDVLHVHDLPLLGTAFSVGKKFKIPVIADLHENYPAALGILNKTGMNFWNRFCTNPKRWSLYERM
ncbi:MAG: glycosyltransferase, partial [candidate division WOR-3 bacterium]